MRSLLIGAALASGLLAALPTLAAQTFKVPITIVPGSVTFQGQGDYTPVGDPVPAAFPISLQVVGVTPNCAAALVTVDADIVDGGFEMGISGYAAGTGCSLGGEIVFEIEMQAPELGGTATAVRFVPTVQAFNFLDYASVDAYVRDNPGTTSSHPDFRFWGGPAAYLEWDGTSDPANPPTTPKTVNIGLTHWIPGDTLRFRVSAGIQMRGNTQNPAQGSARTRFEYRVTVPEPSAGLSLPIGALTLLGIAALRG